MTSAQPSNVTPATPGSETRFRPVLKETWNLFTKAPLQLLAVYVLPSIAYTALSALSIYTAYLMDADPMNLGYWGLSVFVLAILGALAQYIGVASVIRGVFLVDHNKFSFQGAYAAAFQKLWQAIVLQFRIFFYTYAWLLLLIALVYAGSMFFLIFTGGNASFNISTVSGIMLLLLVIVGIFVLIRSLATVFSFSILMSEEQTTGKEALKKSIELSNNRKLRIFTNIFLFVLMILPFAGFYGALSYALFLKNFLPDSFELEFYRTIVFSPMTILVSCFGLIFNYAFMKKMKVEKNVP